MVRKLEDLPAEILEHIVLFLDIPPPSVAQSAQEPKLKDLYCNVTPLKNLALVSASWHRMVTPLVFTYLRLSVVELQGLAVMSQEEIESQEVLRKAKSAERSYTWQSRQWTNTKDGQTFYASLKALSSDSVVLERYDKTELVLDYHELSKTDEHYVSMMANHVQDQLTQAAYSRVTDETRALEKFLRRRASQCSSLLVYSHSSYEKNFDTAGHHVSERAKIWNLTKRYVNPARLVLIAPPELLARLAHCFTNVTDLWSFHIPFQRIELCQRHWSAGQLTYDDQRKQNYEDAEVETSGYGLLHSRYWRSFEYDEGSSLNIYGTYHYFEKRPPSIINLSSTHIESLGSWLETFTYTSIFPHHAHFIRVIEAIEGFKALMHLRVKLAPSQSSELLADDIALNRGNLNMRDCWDELERCYESLCERLLTSNLEPPQQSPTLPVLKTFYCLDSGNPWVAEKLETLRLRWLPDWTMQDDGIWTPVEERPVFRNWREEKGSSSTAVETELPDPTVLEPRRGSSRSAGHPHGYVAPMFGAYDP